ncbi:TPA: signal recognition particle-docking protein FtsY, partial [Candidatus Bathyarchaeota archaeon]|nr:signal recognition particle-docking protein FtsY [Candidatus Bathyarchaeota archaeon]
MFDGLKDKISKFFEKTSKVELKGKSVDELLDELRLSLIENDVALPVADQICSTFKGELEKVEVPRFGDKKRLVKSIFKETLKKFLIPSEKFDLMNVIDRKRELREPAVLLFMGVNGTGKTTTIAKIAYLLLKSGRTVVLACSDTFRAGAIEQLEEHARRVGVKVIKHRYGADPAAAAFDAINYARSKGINAVLIDTAGRMQTDKNLL